MTELLRPVYHPCPYEDEAPVGYLIRVCEANQYNKLRWIYRDHSGDGGVFTLHPKVILGHLVDSPWTGFDQIKANVEPYCTLADRELGHVLLRYCPDCLAEEPYYRVQWQIRAAVACVKHRTWLVDRCPECFIDLKLRNKSTILTCCCGADLTSAQRKEVSNEVLRYQQFVDGVSRYHNHNCFWLADVLSASSHCLDYRVQFARVLSQWQPVPGNQFNKTGHALGLATMSVASTYVSELAKSLFCTAKDFDFFLDTLHHHIYEDQSKGDLLFRQFYKMLCRFIGETCQPLIEALYKYINYNWHYPLTHKNTLFADSVIKAHPWMALQAACRRYKIGKSLIRRAIRTGEIQSKTSSYEESGRQFILLYLPDVIKYVTKDKQMVNGLEAARILGVTKEQFYQLIEGGILYGESPTASYYPTWVFERVKLQELLDRFITDVPVIKGQFISLPDALRKIGNGIKNPLVPLLKAIDGGNLGVVYRDVSATGFRSAYISEDKLKAWYDICVSRVPKGTYSFKSITQALSVHKELVPALVNKSIIKVIVVGSRGRRCIPQQALAEFKECYVLLSKLSKKSGISVRELKALIESRGIKAIDHEYPENEKFINLVYYRDDLIKIKEVSHMVCSMGDWDFLA